VGKRLSRFAYENVRSLCNIPLKRRLFGDKAGLVPPFHLMQDGLRDYAQFKQNGVEVFNQLVAFGLKPTDCILDIGSGIGRKTIPLLDFLTSGSYEGIDPVREQVQWCSERITPRYPNFTFQRVDLFNKYYNPTGKIMPSEYIFPFRGSEFDFVALNSVFTHMFSPEMLHYISEVARLLKPRGGGLVTFFLLNRESEALIAGGKSNLNLLHEGQHGSKADNADNLETAIGHQEAFVAEAFHHRGITMQIMEYGSWCGRPDNGHYQDFVRLEKRG
jgi:SAM-dependent methyltransferase